MYRTVDSHIISWQSKQTKVKFQHHMRWNRVKLDKICDIQVKVVEIKSTGVFYPTEAAKSSSPTPPIENGKMFKRGKGELSSQTNIFEKKTLQICLV